MESKKPAFYVLLSGILWGVISIFIKQLSAAGFDSMQISAIRMLVSAVLFTTIIAITNRDKLKIKLKDIWIFIGTGIVSVVLFNCTYFYTMIHSQASIAVILLYTSPIFVMIMSAIFFKEKITSRKITALIMTLAGCVLVAGVIGTSYKLTPLIVITGIGSGFFYALYSIFGRVALQKYDTLTVTAYTFIFGMIGALPIGKVGKIVNIVSENPKIIFWCIGIGIVSTVLPYFFYTKGLQQMESGKAAILAAVEPLVGAIIGMTLFHESHDTTKLIGIVLIFAAIILLNISPKKVRD